MSLEHNQFLQRTQAFTSPTYMASCQVWENLTFSMIHSFGALCEMLVCTVWVLICLANIIMLIIFIVDTWLTILFMFVVTDVIVRMYLTSEVIGKCYCHVVLMADNLCHCDMWYSHFFIIVTDGNHMRDNW